MKEISAVNIKTCAVWSAYMPVAFISRAKLPECYDLVFTKHARYSVEHVAIAKSPFAARRLVKKHLKTHQQNYSGEAFYYHCEEKELLPLLANERLRRVLSGLDAMSPTWGNQLFWAEKLGADQELLQKAQAQDVWKLLLSFNLPLIKELSISSHYSSIEKLGLANDKAPELSQVSKALESYGWRAEAVSGEINPQSFFSLLKSRIFPVATELRPLHALFCGYEPDYWHETIGHLATLTDPEIADFYQWCGEVVERVKNESNDAKTLSGLYKIFLYLLEYGIIKQNGELKVFGGALASSFMALQRFKRGFIKSIPFDPKKAIWSGIATEFPIRRSSGKIELFYVDSIREAKARILHWAGLF